MSKYKTKLYKGFICTDPTDAFFEKIAKAGGEGIEISSRSLLTRHDPSAADELAPKIIDIRNRAEKFDLRFHSIMHGASYNSHDQAIRENSFKLNVKMIRIAARLGCDSMLSVPVRLDNKINMPKPHEFKIDFDPKTCHITSIVEGNNKPYKNYIEEHNFAVDMLKSYYERLIPTLAYEGITLAPENVWNNFMVHPELMASIVKMFNCKWICCNYDLGNNVKYRPNPAQALRIIGAGLIAKIHIKDFIINHSHKNGGLFVPIGFGDIPWREVRDAIEEIGYSGWITLEDINHFTPEEHVKILDHFFNGTLTRSVAESIHSFSCPDCEK